MTGLLMFGVAFLISSLSPAQELIDDPDSPHPNYVRAYLKSDEPREDDLQPYKLARPNLISNEEPKKESVFKLKYAKALKKTPEPSRVSLGVPSMEAKILAVPLYSNVYLTNNRSRMFFSAGGGVLSIGMAGGGYEFNGRSGLLVRFSAHAAYSDKFYPLAGMRIGSSF